MNNINAQYRVVMNGLLAPSALPRVLVGRNAMNFTSADSLPGQSARLVSGERVSPRAKDEKGGEEF
jgi:hypothetical protein